MSTRAAECIWPVGAKLGEGCVWVEREQAVYFVDIKGDRVHRLSTGSGAQRSWDAPRQPSFILPHADGDFVCGTQGLLQRFDPQTGAFRPALPVEPDKPQNRCNDGATDAEGRLWFGTMDDAESGPNGSFYRLDLEGRLSVQDAGIPITNGPTISPDGAVLYHTDTLGQTVYAFDRSPDGELSNKRPFVRFDGRNFPDGMACDSEGCVWVALYGGWGVERFSPSGQLVWRVEFPCPNVTKLAFGGPGLKTAYATTAWQGMSAEARREHPLSGGLFRFDVEVAGLPQPLCRVRLPEIR